MGPGNYATADPYLYTGDRLLIRTAYRGTNAPSWGAHGAATLRLEDEDGGYIAQASSGFN